MYCCDLKRSILVCGLLFCHVIRGYLVVGFSPFQDRLQYYLVRHGQIETLQVQTQGVGR